jgi:N-acetylmuramoyl-L-alanine amidase
MNVISLSLRIFAAVMILAGGVFGASPSHAAFINGQNYVPLADWAGANGLELHWFGGKTVGATNRTTRLVFNVDSAQLEINGVQVRLSFPVADAKGVPLIAQFDLDKTIRPLLFPSRYIEPKKITTICLDAGHGGKDTGEHFESHNEKTYTLALALELRDQLQKAGFSVVMTRKTDTFVKLPDRAAFANSHKADLFICLHFNATVTDRAEIQGPETYCITPAGANSSNSGVESSEFGTAADADSTVGNRSEKSSLLLAYELQKSMVRDLNANDRGVKRARFQVLRETEMPGVLIEGGFMTHPVEGKKIFDAAYRKQMAMAIVKGILNYKKLTAPQVVQPTTTATNQQAIIKSASTPVHVNQ